MWWNNVRGQEDCRRAQVLLESLDHDGGDTTLAPASNAGQLQPATQQEVDLLQEQNQCIDEPLDSYIRRTCVWCKRSGPGCHVDRSILEYLVRSPSIYLHAIQYSLRVNAKESVSFRTNLPEWANH